MKIEIPGHNLYLVLHTHKHGVSQHFFAVPKGGCVCADDFGPFVEDFDPDTEEIEIIGPITIDDVRVLDLNDKEKP